MWTKTRRLWSVEAASFAANLLSLALPLVVIQIFDRAIPAEGYATLAALALFLLGAALAETVLRAASAAVQNRLSVERDLERTGRLLHNLLYARTRLADASDPVEERAHFETSGRLRDLEAGDLKSSRFDLPFALAFVSVFALIAPSLLWALLLAIALVILPGRAGPGLERLQDERGKRSKRLNDFLTQTLAGIESIKGLRAEAFLQRRFEALSAGNARLTGAVARLRGVRRARGEVASQAIPAFMALVGAWSVSHGTMTAGTLAAAILLSGRAVQPMLRALSARDGRRGLKHAVERLDSALQTPSVTGGDLDLPPLQRLEARRIVVRDAEGVVRLDEVSACLWRGGALAVTGPSGSGKSLLLHVLKGDLLPDEGQVLWNDTPVQRFDADALAARVVMLRDVPRLPSVRVIDYLTDEDPGRADAALAWAVRLGAGKELALSEEGLESRLGGPGSSLLPSLEARIPMARALARAPDLLLFDDANNALDMESDGKVLDALKARPRSTALVVASARPSYLRLASDTLHLSIERAELVQREAAA